MRGGPCCPSFCPRRIGRTLGHQNVTLKGSAARAMSGVTLGVTFNDTLQRIVSISNRAKISTKGVGESADNEMTLGILHTT